MFILWFLFEIKHGKHVYNLEQGTLLARFSIYHYDVVVYLFKAAWYQNNAS